MFSKKQRRAPAISTLVGTATRVNGDLEFKGGCLIDGHVLGNVRSVEDDEAMLSISERGSVEGTIEVANVLLNGTVKGDVKARHRVELGARAKVHGNVEYGLIEMAIGAAVNGKLLHAGQAMPAGAAAGRAGMAGPESEAAAEPEMAAEPAELELEPEPKAGGNINAIGEST
jgi:cytoskeletal protein CcmA (bactofilin family)